MSFFLLFIFSFLGSLLSVFAVRRFSFRVGWVHRPDPRKWSLRGTPYSLPVAMGGGIGIYGGFLLGVGVFLLFAPSSWLLKVSALATVALFLGILDDLYDYPPFLKLFIQTLLGLATVLWVGWVQGLPVWFSIPVTIFGIVGLMNSINMMDNMDGIASGLVTLAMFGYALLGVMTQNAPLVYLSLVIAGASFGFWWFNKPPATIFMGDTGSLFLGYLFGVVGVLATQGSYPHWLNRFFSPLVLAALFVMDTIFVVLWRSVHRRPIMRGDCNHISHRVATFFGRSEGKANAFLYALQILTVVSVPFLVSFSPLKAFIFALSFVAGLIGFGAWLWGISVEEGAEKVPS